MVYYKHIFLKTSFFTFFSEYVGKARTNKNSLCLANSKQTASCKICYFSILNRLHRFSKLFYQDLFLLKWYFFSSHSNEQFSYFVQKEQSSNSERVYNLFIVKIYIFQIKYLHFFFIKFICLVKQCEIDKVFYFIVSRYLMF